MATKETNTNDYRLERKKRLAKAAKKQKKGSADSTKLVSGIITAVFIVAILALAAFGLYEFGVPQKVMPALTVGDRTYTAAEYSYYYTSVFQSYANQQSTLGIQLFDTTKDPAAQTTTDEDGNTLTYDELFKNTVKDNLETSNYYLGLAEKEGTVLSDENKKAIEDTISELSSYASQYGYSATRYVSMLYGKGLNLKKFRSLLEDQYLVSQYITDQNDAAYKAVTDEEIEKAYAEAPADYQITDIRLLGLALPEDDSTATDTDAAEKSEETLAVEARANEMLAKITDEDSFIELAKEYCDEENKEAFQDESASLARSIKKSVVSTNISEELAEWLFDAARKTGDKTVFTADSYVYVIYVVNPAYRNEDKLVSARHILVSFASVKAELEAAQATATDAAAADDTAEKEVDATDGTKVSNAGTGYSAEVVLKAYEDAKAILDQFKAGEATEDAFAALAEENSDDTGSVGENGTGGGLYENIEKGQMVAPFENWVYDESRQPGDTGIVQTNYGYHVMYFVSKADEPSWKADIRTSLGDKVIADKEEAAKAEIADHAEEKAFYSFACGNALKLVNKLYVSSANA